MNCPAPLELLAGYHARTCGSVANFMFAGRSKFGATSPVLRCTRRFRDGSKTAAELRGRHGRTCSKTGRQRAQLLDCIRLSRQSMVGCITPATGVPQRRTPRPKQDVAKEHLLDWRTVKTLEMQYMREQIKRAGQPRPKVVGIDEISIRKGQTYRIVVSDLDRRRAIWFGGKDRSEESMDMFFAFLGERSSTRVRLAVMDMWRPFRTSTDKNARQALPFYSISSTS
jgi:transposase